MVDALESSGFFNSQHIQRLLYDTDGCLVPFRIGTDRAWVGLDDIEAGGALSSTLLYPRYRFGKTPRLVGRTSQYKEGQSLRGLGTDARQLSKLLNKRRHRRRRCLHSILAIVLIFTLAMIKACICATCLESRGKLDTAGKGLHHFSGRLGCLGEGILAG